MKHINDYAKEESYIVKGWWKGLESYFLLYITQHLNNTNNSPKHPPLPFTKITLLLPIIKIECYL